MEKRQVRKNMKPIVSFDAVSYTHLREDMAKVLLYLPISLFVGVVLRKQVIRMNDFFERKLEETGVM